MPRRTVRQSFVPRLPLLFVAARERVYAPQQNRYSVRCANDRSRRRVFSSATTARARSLRRVRATTDNHSAASLYVEMAHTPGSDPQRLTAVDAATRVAICQHAVDGGDAVIRASAVATARYSRGCEQYVLRMRQFTHARGDRCARSCCCRYAPSRRHVRFFTARGMNMAVPPAYDAFFFRYFAAMMSSDA